MDFKDFLMESFEEAEVVEKEVMMGDKPRLMKFKPISAAEGDRLRKQSRKTYNYKGQRMQETDADLFIDKLIVASTVYPDFKNAQLQDSWGVVGELELFKAMKAKMSDGEFNQLAEFISELNGYDKDINDKVDEAKN